MSGDGGAASVLASNTKSRRRWITSARPIRRSPDVLGVCLLSCGGAAQHATPVPNRSPAELFAPAGERVLSLDTSHVDPLNPNDDEVRLLRDDGQVAFATILFTMTAAP